MSPNGERIMASLETRLEVANNTTTHTNTSTTLGMVEPSSIQSSMKNDNNNKPSCHLKWTNIIKTVEIKDQAVGLIRSSIGGSTQSSNQSTKAGDIKVILNQISAEAKPGEIFALMGPSGSGKTSLLDVLASRSTYDKGSIYLNDVSMTENPDRMKALKRKIAYIKQKDIFFEHLSVRDQLMYTAFLRLGDDYSKEAKLAEVERVIKLLRLEKCAETQIMLVSG